MSTGTADLPAATRLAVDRTLLAWVRTSTSLISFGFTIYKFFQYLRESQKVEAAGFLGPRGFALLMISIGVIVLVVATIQHRREMRALRAEYGQVPYSLATMLAGLIAGLGILGLLAVIFHQ
jgi:inner membrane protein YidH